MFLSKRKKSRFDFWSFQQKIKACNKTIVENFTSPDKLKKGKKIFQRTSS